MLYAIVAVLVIIVDQAMKYWVAGNIALGTGVREVIPGILSLVNLHNDGAAFSFLGGGGARIYFIIICGVFSVLIILGIATNFISTKIGRWSAVMVMAGGIANCIDRILNGYVQDMFKLDFMNFAIFNVADIFITVFCFIFILDVIFGGKGSRDEDALYDDEDEDYDDGYEQEEDDYADERYSPMLQRGREKGREAVEKLKSERDKNSRKGRQARYEAEYEQYKAARAVRQQQSGVAPAPIQRSTAPAAPVRHDPNDPFAEWERANARAEQERSYSQSYMRGEEPARESAYRSAAPLERGYAPAPVERSYTPAPAERSYAPAEPVAPAPQQRAAAPKAETAAPAVDDFNLDDILAEFKF